MKLPKWHGRAACAEAPIDLIDKFFPAGRPAAEPKSLCHRCPVRQECLDFALDSPWQPRAIIAGFDPGELAPLWRQRHPENNQGDTYRALGLR